MWVELIREVLNDWAVYKSKLFPQAVTIYEAFLEKYHLKHFNLQIF